MGDQVGDQRAALPLTQLVAEGGGERQPLGERMLGLGREPGRLRGFPGDVRRRPALGAVGGHTQRAQQPDGLAQPQQCPLITQVAGQGEPETVRTGKERQVRAVPAGFRAEQVKQLLGGGARLAAQLPYAAQSSLPARQPVAQPHYVEQPQEGSEQR